MAINFPVPTFIGQQYTPPGSAVTYQWDGTCWNIVPQMGPMYIGDNPPPNPAVGQKWWRSTNGQEYLWYDDGTSKQWVQSAGAAAAPGIPEFIADVDLAPLTSTNFVPLLNLGAYRDLLFDYDIAGAQGQFGMQFSADNGGSWFTTSGDYTTSVYSWWQNPGSAQGSAAASNIAYLTSVAGNNNYPAIGNFRWTRFNKAQRKTGSGHYYASSAANANTLYLSGSACAQALAMNALRFVTLQPGANDGHCYVWGIRG